MKFVESRKALALSLLVLLAFSGCGDGSDDDSSGGVVNVISGPNTANGSALPAMSGDNVIPLTVNGSLCSAQSYSNKPCVSVTICQPGTSNCQTINDILLDTGSYGLRLFSQAITVPLPQVMSGNNSIAECVQFGDGSSDWGPLKMATVVLGGETPVSVPIQVIDSTMWNSSQYCPGADQSPADAGFNGILGVGLFAQDCGSYCSSTSNNGMYFACNGAGCSGAAVSGQVINPVAALSQDNNGVIVELPSVALGGEPFADGYLVLGIGTRTNNTPSGVVKYAASANTGDFTTRFNGSSYAAFLDSGSNGLFVPMASGLTDCGSDASGWYCPTGTPSFNATVVSLGGAPTGQVSFQIGNALDLMNSGNSVFSELGGDSSGQFDWGLPFYFGRNVYVGIENATSSLGTGPYWAF